MNLTGWLRGLRRYLAVIAIGDLIWEAAHLPLYTVWTGGTARDKLVAVVHCTAGRCADRPLPLGFRGGRRGSIWLAGRGAPPRRLP